MERLVKLNGQASGRDKIARLVQYSCRTLWDCIQNDSNFELIDKIKTLEYILGSFRKLLRFGKCIDVMYASFKSVHNPDVTLRLTLTLSKISQAIYLFADHILWLSRTGLFKNIDTNKWNTTANKYWVLSIVMNLCRDFYEICQIFDTCRDVQQLLKLFFFPKSSDDLVRVWSKAKICVSNHQAVMVDTVKNVCDVFIPLTALGYTKLSPKHQGILGVISSIVGLFEILYPAAKLLPA